MSAELDLQFINTLRFLAVDMVQNANSGHPGLPLDAAPMAYTLWTRQLKHHPANPHRPDRDRFVLSPGHGSALLYSLLYVTGYALSLEDLKQFRQWGSKAPGHPERGHTPGVEVTTGPLGQGLANAVGMAIGEAHLAARYNRDGHRPITGCGPRRYHSAHIDCGTHSYWLRLTRAGQLKGTWVAARRGRRETDQTNAGLAHRAAVPGAGACPGVLSRSTGVSPRPNTPGTSGCALMRGHSRRWPRSWKAGCAVICRKPGIRSCRYSRPMPKAWPAASPVAR